MSWYRDYDGKIVVCKDCEHLVHEHIGFQMGTMRCSDGRMVLLDMDLLSMCGKRKRRPRPHMARRRRGLGFGLDRKLRERWRSELPIGCPADNSKCRFFNNYLAICAATAAALRKENVPCKEVGACKS